MTERHHVEKNRWADVLPELLKGEASQHLDSEVESKNQNRTYDEIVDLLTRTFREFNVQTRACEELASRVQLEDEGVAAFASAIKRLAMKAYPESEQIRQWTIREHLYQGLRDEMLQFEVKRQVMENAEITMADLEKALCFMEPAPDGKPVMKQAVSMVHLTQVEPIYQQSPGNGMEMALYTLMATTSAPTPAPATAPRSSDDQWKDKWSIRWSM